MGGGTRTSKFGVSKREGHDSTPFYGGKLYKEVKVNEVEPEKENPVPCDV